MSIITKFDKLCEFSRKSYQNYTITLLGDKIDVQCTIKIDELFLDHISYLNLRIDSISLQKDRVILVNVREI